VYCKTYDHKNQIPKRRFYVPDYRKLLVKALRSLLQWQGFLPSTL